MPGASAQNVIVGVAGSRPQAEEYVEYLHQAGIDAEHVSLAALDSRQESGPGADGAQTGRPATGQAVLRLPRMGRLGVTGPLSSWIAAAVENEAVFGGFTALGAALYSLGIAKGAVLRYEAAVLEGKTLVIAYGTAGELKNAREILAASAFTLE